jgi:hypothetical protein
VPFGAVAAITNGDSCLVTDPIEISRRVRHRIDTAGLQADIAADVNVALSTGGGAAVSRQHAPIRQGRSKPAGPGAPDPKESP